MVLVNNRNREPQIWTMGNLHIEEVQSTKHIGQIRQSEGKNYISSRIQKGRRTMYALLGAGLHGKNGINPEVAHKIYVTFCRPRITNRLETVILSKSEEHELLTFEKRLLKQLQGLPDRCSTTAVYVLIGAIPITMQIEKNSLGAFYNITISKGTTI